MRTPEQGAATSIHLASAPELAHVTGSYFANSRPKQSSRPSYDDAVAARLWDVSCALIGIHTADPHTKGRRHEGRRTPGQLHAAGRPAVDRPDDGRRRARRRGGRGGQPVADGPLLPAGDPRRGRPSRCSRATPASASSPAHTSTVRAAAAGHRRDLPPPRPARQDRLDARRALRRPRRARHRRRLVRAGAPGARRTVSRRWPSGSSGSRRRCRSCARCGATTTAPTSGSTTSSPRRSTRRSRCGPPPIMVGGGGEKKTLRLVAKYADACNLFAGPTRRSRPRSHTSSTCCASTARGRAPTTTHPQDRPLRRLPSDPTTPAVPRSSRRCAHLRPWNHRGTRDAVARRSGRLRPEPRRARRTPALPALTSTTSRAPTHERTRYRRPARSCQRRRPATCRARTR